MKTQFLAPAREEFLASVDFYEARARGLGNDFIDDVESAVKIVAENPELGSLFAHGTRRVLLQRFPFALIYMIEPEMLIIIAVAHQRQRPGYWKDRLEA
ncbi:type II toxin-antitoxin system RelE/ParE family toxin [Bradymonas sediminis]|uniref:Type II toxin-antitoxin system RelE/ParE family toxin n=1 Tax=Bradymonas sediminis TaxID=1548548 RepID=A0A2Z4FQE9_9DELT|nr:type II toxin-antitoxin system RelE/ParE family toxin [Bradymonas sediminis]AWV91150.1 type II toxin-antitoxin system RelE/ParE family toxin [Bradymonas sediminis]